MKYLSVTFTLLLLLSCTNEKKNPDKRLKEKDVPANFDIGTFKDGVFKNEFFKLSFRYNEDWDVQTYEELEKLMQLSSDYVAGDNESLRRNMDASSIRTAHHFAAYKYDIDSYYDFNPSIIVMSENISMFNGIEADDYLEKIRNLWPQTAMDIEQEGTIRPESIDGKIFYKLTAIVTTQGMEIRQDYLCQVIDGFALVFILSYLDDDQLAELNAYKSTIKLK